MSTRKLTAAAVLLLVLLVAGCGSSTVGLKNTAYTATTPDQTALAALTTQVQQLSAAVTADTNAAKVMTNAGGKRSLANAQTDLAGAQSSNQTAVAALTPAPPVTTTTTTTTPSTTTTTPVGGTPFFDGTFSTSSPPGPNWPSVYGSCYSVLTSTEVQYNVTSSCNPGGDGHYRIDLCSANGCNNDGTVAAGDVYQAGTATCTSIPVDFTNLPTVPTSSWLQFAEAKDYEAGSAGWGFGVTSYWGATNEFQVTFDNYDNTAPAYHGTTGLATGWNTYSICTNNANNSSGEVYGVYINGQQLTFNYGPSSGSQTLSGFAIIDDGASSWPLDINDYTGGTPVPNTIIHGDPLVTLGSSSPPEPAGGWNSP